MGNFMTRFRIKTVLLGALLLSAAGPVQAGDWNRGPHEEWRRRSHEVPGYDHAPEARGCYWHRQRQYCSRYCYVEVDGRRFCQERQRHAFPQAPHDETILVLPEAGSGMKLGRGRTDTPAK